MAAQTGLLSYLRGANFSHNNFNGDTFPLPIDEMPELKWLKLNATKLYQIPEELEPLEKLETLDLSHNNLTSLNQEITCLKNLKVLCCRYNQIVSEGIPVDLFCNIALTVLDLSHNNLKKIPKTLEDCKSLTVLNLSHNNISCIPEQLFRNLFKLKHLNLSDNQLETIPPSIGRLSGLCELILDNNPLKGSKLKHIERMKSLCLLHLANTQRNSDNIPPILLGELTKLVELNLSSNDIVKVPNDLCNLKLLRRLNLSENSLEKLPEDFGTWWPNLTTLNLSGNKLKKIPASLCKLCNLKRLYLNDNMLTFEGLPAALSKLKYLEIFMAARNNLDMIPESIIRCGNLKKLILTSNKLITLPDTIHLLYDLEVLDLSNNPDLIMPPKPISDSARNSEFYNIDFSLDTQLRLVGDSNLVKPPASPRNEIRSSEERKQRLRRRAKEDVDQAQQETNQKVLNGMRGQRENLAGNQSDLSRSDLIPRRWDENLERPPTDYKRFFGEGTGQTEGLTIWEIVKFYPKLMDETIDEDYGVFYEAECYIVLDTRIDENLSPNWRIFYWIGKEASLDKKACSAIHAVGLRNHLNAYCRTIREEQGEESKEFLALFSREERIEPRPGVKNSSGFRATQEMEYPRKMFRLHELAENTRQLHLETVDLFGDSLDFRLVFIVDIGTKIFVWNGMDSKNTTRQKARLFVERLNKEERKNKAELVFCEQGDEPPELLEELGLSAKLPRTDDVKTPDLPKDFEPDNFVPLKPILYQPFRGCGYIELLQVDFKPGHLLNKFLVANNVFILDCMAEVFVWLGRRSERDERNLACGLAEELLSMIDRPDFSTITICFQGTESQLFKSKFRDWDDVIAVDYTRTAGSVSKTGADLSKWMSAQKVKIDLASLFVPMPKPETDDRAQRWFEFELIETLILDKTKRFVVDGHVVNGAFVEIPRGEFGHFYTDDCYVFRCQYFIPLDDSSASDDKPIEENQETRLTNGVSSLQNGETPPFEEEEDWKMVVYFWQGRQAPKMGWLTFTFSLQKEYEARFGNKLQVIQMQQQQENSDFLSLFGQKFVIHRGKRKSGLPQKPVALYHIRSNGNPLTLRCIEIEPESSKLNSGFCYLLRLTSHSTNGYSSQDELSEDQQSETSSTIYVWLGSKSSRSEQQLAESIAKDRFSCPNPVIFNEGQEPEVFWSALGGRQQYETDASFMQHIRLFKCSNDKGYFNITECFDFCQDHLSDDDIMILDNGTQVFLWIGPKSSEVEVKLAYKSAQVYVQSLRLKDPNQRQLMLTFKGKESKKFTKCFHAWSHHKVLQDPRP